MLTVGLLATGCGEAFGRKRTDTRQASRAAAAPRDAIVFDNATSNGLDARIELAYVPDRGGAVVPVTQAWRHGMVAAEPRWSPDGSQIAFVMSPKGYLTRYAGDGDIYVMNSDGTGIHRVTHGLDASAPVWSPDGSRIVFIKGQGQQLAVIRADGADQHVITGGRGYYESPTWSPDGREIAYISGRDWHSAAIFTIRPDGTVERQLTPGSVSLESPAWSPRGSRLAYSSRNRLWIMSSDGANAHAVTNCRLPCVDDFDPAWSPTGHELAFVRQQDDGAARRLAVVDLVTDKVSMLTPNLHWVGSPDWRP